jgi:hypothetical protein
VTPHASFLALPWLTVRGRGRPAGTGSRAARRGRWPPARPSRG